MSAPALRRGWCPGALRPMRTGDGLLVRVRISGGALDPALAEALAQAARRHGNGLVDLSARANLQLRGVSEATLAPLQACLADLGVLDSDPDAETVRNVMVAPLAGIDPGAVDVRPLAAAVERALVADAALHRLPPKFGFLVDGGGALPLAGVEADIRLTAGPDGRVALEAGGVPAGTVGPSAAAGAALALARAFLALRQSEERRMREMVARCGVAALVEAVGSLCGAPLAPSPSPQDGGGRQSADGDHLRSLAGFRGLEGTDGAGFLAAAAPFGRLSASQLEGLARLARQNRAGLRLTPWRAILIAPVPASAAPALAAAVAELGLVIDPADPRLAVAACPGRPACLSGEADVQADALAFLAALGPLPPGVTMHVSGCAKGCARRQPASLMLVARNGRYGLAFGADAAAPSATPPMAPADMARHLAALDLNTLPERPHARA